MTSAPSLATPDQRHPLARTFADAFIDDPMIRWPLAADAGPREFVAMFEILLTPYIELGVMWHIQPGPSGAAAAAWLDPETTSRFGDIDRAMRRQVGPLTDDDGVRYAAFWDWLGSHVPAEPCWFLDMVAVDPTHQGQGLGRTLIEHGLKLATADGLPAFLETSQRRNVEYYQGFGFEVLATERAPDGGPQIWFMRRPTRPS